MTKFEIKGNQVISESLHNTHTFDIVDRIPNKFFVWNIGENMGHPEYIPICEDLHPEDRNNYDINTSTLKAIKLPAEEVQLLRAAAHWGVTSKAEAEKALKSKRKGYTSNQKRYYAEKTIDIFNRITV